MNLNEFNTNMINLNQDNVILGMVFIPLWTLESISDESEYNIDDRKNFQIYTIKLSYIITENDFRELKLFA